MFSDLSFFALFLIGLTGMGLVLGPCMAAVYQGRVGALRRVENAFYRLAGVSGAGQKWTGYAASVLLFNAAGFCFMSSCAPSSGCR